MAEDKSRASGSGSGSSSSSTATEAAPEAEEFPVERLQDESAAFFGHPPHVFAGALDLAKERKKNLTIEEGQEHIKAFLKHVPEEA